MAASTKAKQNTKRSDAKTTAPRRGSSQVASPRARKTSKAGTTGGSPRRAKTTSKANVLVQQLRAALEAQKTLGGSHYPSTLAQLLPYIDTNDASTAAKALGSPAAKKELTWFVAPKAKLERRLEAAVCLRGDEPTVFHEEAFYVDVLAHQPDGTDLVPATAFLPSPALKKSFGRAVAERLRALRDAGALRQIGGLQWKRGDHYFLLSRVRGGAIEARALESSVGADEPTTEHVADVAVPEAVFGDVTVRLSTPLHFVEDPDDRPMPGDFAELFAAAFERLDQGDNWVRLVDLRNALHVYDRETFDAALQAVRRERLFGLEGAEGRHRTPTEEELAAAIYEHGRALLFVTRRDV